MVDFLVFVINTVICGTAQEVVFQCRDEGSTRAPVRWVREGGRRLPPGSTDIRGRLTMPNIQASLLTKCIICLYIQILTQAAHLYFKKQFM